MNNSLELFHPLIRQWFTDRLGAPTDVQARSWPHIADGHHVLITAPTGSGKTLTAFLWALDRLITGAWERGRMRVLYVSPLKALNNDIQRNLMWPLAELRLTFERAGRALPEINVLTRSGDTEQKVRRRMLSHPPEILITTPESLNLMLASPKSRSIFTGLNTVILDEIHSVAGTKRGTHLITAVDRLVPLAGEFQRIALSATIRPLETVADFVGGYTMQESAGRADYDKRAVRIIESPRSKEYDICVRFPREVPTRAAASWWGPIVAELKRIIGRSRSTLLFTNNRRLCERVSMMINEDEEKPMAYSHHGSLSRETRLVVEERLKRGELAAIVATTTLELGIDVGALDEVVLIETPSSVSSAVQRVGRAGHNVGEVSKGTLLPVYARDFLNAAVMARSIVARDIEDVRPIANPLDVLAQVIVSMTIAESWDLDELYNFLRASYPYQDLPRRQFDLVVNMLTGRYAETRLRELRPLVSVDRIDNTIRARGAAPHAVYLSGGTIPDRGYFNLRLKQSNARIGELDEEFVWERSLGDTFTLGTQTWKISGITHNEVLVVPGGARPAQAPFWRAEAINRDYHLSERILEFLELADGMLDAPELAAKLQHEYAMEQAAAAELIRFLKRQKQTTGAQLPHRHHVVVEHLADLPHAPHGTHVILHTLWGGKVNHPFALALAAAWEKEYRNRLEVSADDDAVVLVLPDNFGAAQIIDLLRHADVEALLRAKLEQSGFFGARFRENAERALLLVRSSFNRRMPLWLNRVRSKKLLNVVSRYEDFPILLETWRTCLQDEFDLGALRRLLDELLSGEIRITEVDTAKPSAFAEQIVRGLVNELMYLDDTPGLPGASRLSHDLLKELVFSSKLRPEIPAAVIEGFREKVQRTVPGYAPDTPLELLEWVKDRLLIPRPEWDALLKAAERDAGCPAREIVEPVAGKLAKVRLPGRAPPAVVALENAPRLLDALQLARVDVVFASVLSDEPTAVRVPRFEETEAIQERDPLADWVAEWLRFYGPVERGFVQDVYGIDQARFEDVLEQLIDARSVVADRLSQGAAQLEICDSENLESLLRIARSEARPSFQPLRRPFLPLFLAAHQGLAEKAGAGGTVEDLQKSLERLFGYPAPAELWEKEFLPARFSSYSTSWMDTLMQESDLVWFGCDRKRIALCFSHNLDLFVKAEGEGGNQDDPVKEIIPGPAGRYSLGSLEKRTRKTSAELTRELWEAVWRGKVTNDSFVALRRAVQNDFEAAPAPRQSRRGTRRSGFGRWKASRPFAGNWYILETPAPPADALEQDELNKERVRALLDRYGILFRELLARELPELSWAGIFRSLRLMELSGEVLAGYFFEGIAGLQFISHDAFRKLQQPLPQDAIFWMNAADPASLCGIGPGDLRAGLPPRLPTTHLVYHGTSLVCVSRKGGKELEISVHPDDPHLPEYLSLFRDFHNRQFQPARVITIETINGEPAHKSPYLECLQALFNVSADYKSVKLWKSF